MRDGGGVVGTLWEVMLSPKHGHHHHCPLSFSAASSSVLSPSFATVSLVWSGPNLAQSASPFPKMTCPPHQMKYQLPRCGASTTPDPLYPPLLIPTPSIRLCFFDIFEKKQNPVAYFVFFQIPFHGNISAPSIHLRFFDIFEKKQNPVAYFVFFQIPFHGNISAPSIRLRFFDIFEKKQNTRPDFFFFQIPFPPAVVPVFEYGRFCFMETDTGVLCFRTQN
jgi:hypothetical protein